MLCGGGALGRRGELVPAGGGPSEERPAEGPDSGAAPAHIPAVSGAAGVPRLQRWWPGDAETHQGPGLLLQREQRDTPGAAAAPAANSGPGAPSTMSDWSQTTTSVS